MWKLILKMKKEYLTQETTLNKLQLQWLWTPLHVTGLESKNNGDYKVQKRASGQ